MIKTTFLTAALIITAVAAAVAQNNKGYVLTGNLLDWKNNKVYLNVDKHLDSIMTDSLGNFEFKGRIINPGMSSLKVIKDGKSRSQGIWIGNTIMKLTGSVASINKLELDGSPDQDLFDAWHKLVIEKAKSYYAKYDQAKERKDSVAMKAERKIADANWGSAYNRIAAEEIYKHPKSPVSIHHLEAVIVSKDYKLADSLATFIEKSGAANLVDLKRLQTYAKKMSQMKTMSVGIQAPGFSQPDVNGKTVTLKDYQGKYVLLDFWASWCGPCRKENPNVLKAYEKFKGKGLEILAISLDDSREKWLQAIQEDHLPWTQVSDLKGGKSEVAFAYGVTAIPANFLIDPTGKIIALSLRGQALENKLQEILK